MCTVTIKSRFHQTLADLNMNIKQHHPSYFERYTKYHDRPYRQKWHGKKAPCFQVDVILE